MTMFRFAIAGLAMSGLVACEMDAVPGGPAGGDGADAMPTEAEGARLFVEYCVVCHGTGGKGDGPMARAMTKPPLDLTLLSVRNGDVYPARKVLSTVDGYARSDLSGPGMPEFGDMLSGDLVPYDSGDGVLTPTPRTLVALTEYLRTIQATR
ncbi:c-type cytochrome [Roseivivax sp. CAU 1753]